MPVPNLFKADGTLKEYDEIMDTFNDAGVDINRSMVFTCGGGIMASVAFSVVEHYKLPGKAAVYDGSWAEYSSRAK